MQDKLKVFVYGTLKKGFANHTHFMVGANLLGNAKIKGDLVLVDLGAFPALVGKWREGGGVVCGEVYEVTPEIMDDLDHLEGHPSFYHRAWVQTVYGRAITYMMPPDVLANEAIPTVPNGLWRPTAAEQAAFDADLVYTRYKRGEQQ